MVSPPVNKVHVPLHIHVPCTSIAESASLHEQAECLIVPQVAVGIQHGVCVPQPVVVTVPLIR